jgi:hypothetical protein
MTAEEKLILCTGEKGGVGKSTLARGLVDLHRADGRRVAAYDADGDVGQLFQHYATRGDDGRLLADQDPERGVVPFDVRAEGDRDTLLNLLDRGAPRVVVDLPAAALHELAALLDDRSASFVEEVRSAGYRPVVVIVITPLLASIRSAKRLLDTLGGLCDFVVVKNGFFGDSDAFPLYDGYTDGRGQPAGGKTRAAVEAHGGVTVAMPALQSRTYSLLDLENLAFDEAVADDRLPRADRSRVHRWRNNLRVNLSQAEILEVPA